MTKGSGAIVACAALGLMVCAGCTTRSSPEEPKPWEVKIVVGGRHVGTNQVAQWPPPLGECIEQKFIVDDLPVDKNTGKPASQVLLGFRHAGDARGTIDINGRQVFSGVTAIDRFASAIADAITKVVVCSIETALPGDANCSPIELSIKTTFVTRRLSTELLVVGTNVARICAPSGDFLLADMRLSEARPESDAGVEAAAEGGSDAR